MKVFRTSYFIYILFFFTMSMAVSSCEKIETEDEKEQTSTDISSEDIDKNKDTDENKNEGNDNGTGENGGSTEEDGNNGSEGEMPEIDDTGYQTGDIVSVSEFLKKDIKCQVWVVGRIVGDCTRSKSYAELNPPFTHSQAILMADSPNEKDIEKMISVCLTTNKGMRNIINLVDNPENFNENIAVFGFRESYLGLCGIKKADGYKFPVNIK